MIPGIEYLTAVVSLSTIYALLALGLNQTAGESGLFNFGIGAFTAIGAYASAIAMLPPPPSGDLSVQYLFGFGLPFPVAMVVAALAAGIVSFVISYIVMPLGGGQSLALVTLGMTEIVRTFAMNEKWLTNGTIGLRNIPKPLIEYVPPPNYQYFYAGILLAAMVITYLLLSRIKKSPFGRVLRSIREDERLAAALGKDVRSFKMRAFVISGVVMGITGCLYAVYFTVISPDQFQTTVGMLVWIALLLGGLGNYKGAILGAFIIYGFTEATRFIPIQTSRPELYASISYIIVAILIILVVLYKPRGIIGEYKPQKYGL